jgi:hypothetical protein
MVVSDNGVGIPVDKQALLFKPFSMVPHTSPLPSHLLNSPRDRLYASEGSDRMIAD